MNRFLIACVCALVMGSAPPTNGGDEGNKPKAEFSGNPRVPANTGFAFDVSPDKQVVTVIFDNLHQEVAPASKGLTGTLGQTASQTKVFTLEVPFSTDQQSVGMTLDLRGYASADKHACVKLVAHAGDKTQVIDVLGAAGGKSGAPVKLKGKAKESLGEAAGTTKEGAADFQKRINFTLQVHAAKPVCQVTLILLAEHDTDTADAGGGLVLVDSLDLSFTAVGQGQYKR